jgi:putative SOS response-associated peptidase YedK
LWSAYWLAKSDKSISLLLKPVADDFLQPVKVSKSVNHARFDGPECAEPAA